MLAHLRDGGRDRQSGRHTAGLALRGWVGRISVHVAGSLGVTLMLAGGVAAPAAGALVPAPGVRGQAAVSSAPGVSQGQAIVDAAAAEAGLPYCASGGSINGPTHGQGGSGCAGSAVGFDCTSLSAYAVYQATGKVLSNDDHQATEGGQIITDQADLQPGDLVFFGRTLDDFLHAGVYAGNGEVWDALDYGYPVQLHSLTYIETDPHERDNFVGAARYWSIPFPDGTFVSYLGSVYRIAGGAPLYVSSWARFGGPQSTVALTVAQWSELNRLPADGTFVDSTTNHPYRIAGGAPFAIGNWNLFGGQQPSVTIDQWDLDNLGDPRAHLSSAPSDGTLVEGLPSGAYWSFIGGRRGATSPSPAAIGVDDVGLSLYPVTTAASGTGNPWAGKPLPGSGGSGGGPGGYPPGSANGGNGTSSGGRCVVPRLRHMTLRRARRALSRAHCRLGKVREPTRARRRRVMRVAGQSAPPRSRHHSGYRVSVKLR